MGYNKDTAAEAAKRDLARRLGVSENDVKIGHVKDTDFPEM